MRFYLRQHILANIKALVMIAQKSELIKKGNFPNPPK